MALKINDENAKELIASGKPVVIDFWAEWCGPCRAIAPSVDELAEEYEGKVIIGKYNVDDDADLSAEYSIRNIPTLLFFKEGKQLKARGQKRQANHRHQEGDHGLQQAESLTSGKSSAGFHHTGLLCRSRHTHGP